MGFQVWKFAVPVAATVPVHMPAGAEILTVQLQGVEPCVWAKVNTDAPKVVRVFRWRGTGHDAYDAEAYVGTIQATDEQLVFHLFVDRE